MQKIEKKLKQKLTDELESNLTDYSVEFSLQNSLTNSKRISRNQYKLINEKLSAKNLRPKFPCYIKLKRELKQNLVINKKNKVIIPEYFQLKNKRFSLDILKITKNLYSLKHGALLFCRLIHLAVNGKQTLDA